VKPFQWDEQKNEWLKKIRGVSFEDVVTASTEGKIVETMDHPNQKRYPNQQVLIIIINEYIHMVPFVEDEEKYFLKTIIPSRKMMKKYMTGGEKK
jgi:uncharacterized DUF497 family protein